MNFITSDPTKKDQEIDKFITYLGYYPNLFEQKKQISVESHIYNFIGEINVKINSTYVDDELYGDAIKQDNNQFRIRYTSGKNKEADKFSAIHELGHVLLTPKDNYIYHNQSVSAQGPCKFNNNTRKFYGIGILEGTVNVIAKLAIIIQDYNKLIEEYLKNGRCDFKQNRYVPLEEIARLLTIASVPYYHEEPVNHLTKLIRNQNIDDIKSSTYLRSCFNNDFEFEKEYNNVFKNNHTCFELYSDIDVIYHQLMNKEEIDKELIKDIILRIESYYHLKLQKEVINGKVDSNKLEMLESAFSSHINKVFNNLRIEREKKRNEI